MHFSEIIKLQFAKECHTLLCMLKLFTNIIHELSLKNAWLPPIFFLDFNKYGLLTKREVKMTGYWPSSFFACLWTETKSRSINTQKKNEANIQSS